MSFELPTTRVVPLEAMLKDVLKERRTKKGWSQAELAREANVSQQLITRIESGNVKESRKLPQIARALGVTVEDLIGRDTAAKLPANSLVNSDDPLLRRLQNIWTRLDARGRRHVLQAADGQLHATKRRKLKKMAGLRPHAA